MAARHLILGIVAVFTLAAWSTAYAVDTAAPDTFKDAGLEKSGDVYVLSDEAPIVAGVKELRLTKVQADKEAKSRKVIESQITRSETHARVAQVDAAREELNIHGTNQADVARERAQVAKLRRRTS